LSLFFEPVPVGIAAVYLFGSTARETSGPQSDVDIAVLYRDTPAHTLDSIGLDIASQLEKHLARRVDWVVLNHAPADLIHRVLRDGVLIVDADKSFRIQFEVRARNEYFDLELVRNRYRKIGAA